MSVAQHQALVLAGLCLAGSIFLGILALSSRRTWFVVFAAFNLFLGAVLFATQVVFGFSGWRSETVAALVSELPPVFLISWVCLAQAGGLYPWSSAVPAEAVAQRPRLRVLLRTAPLFLLLGWGFAAIVGLVWPSPAMQAYASAPPQFVVFKWSISAAEAFYSILATWVFVLAARSSTATLALRLKNVAFAVALFCLASIAVESAIVAGIRLWGSDEGRRDVVETLLTLEVYLAAFCFGGLVLGLALRYTPTIAATFLRQLHTSWIPAQERFESLKWRAVISGQARGAIKASHRIVEAAKLRGLSQAETEKALATIQLVATLKDPSAERAQITPEAARELYQLQEEILDNDALASRISWAARWDSRIRESRTVKSEPLHDALKATLDLIDCNEEQADPIARPLWYHLVAVSAADIDLISPEMVRTRLGRQPEYRMAYEAYHATKASARSRRLYEW
jgi:hypothetical protein